MLAHNEDHEIVNVHTTPQDLDPWYLADDPNDDDILTDVPEIPWADWHSERF